MLPTEILAEILVFAAADSSISNAQRLELCRVCRAGHFAIHSRVLFPTLELNSAGQVHALAQSFRRSHDLERIARRVTRSLSIALSDGSAGTTSRSDTLYGSIQRQADLEQDLTTPLRLLLTIFTSLDRLYLDMTPAPLDYRLRRTAVLSKSVSSSSAPKQAWTWGRASISHRAHVERRTPDPLSAFRSHLTELICMQNVLGAGDFVDQLNIGMNPIPTLGRWDRLESLQLLGPRFRLTCSSARTLGLGLPRLKRLALVMPNIMPPSRSTPEGEDANTTDEDEGDDPEEVGRDLFLRMSPLQVLIDTLCPSDSILPPKDSHTSSTEEKPSSPIFEHLLIVGHDLPIYVGSSTKLRRWIEGLQYRVRRRTPSPADHDRRYYLDPDSRFGDSSTGANGWEEEEEVQQPQIQLLTARLSPNEDAADDALPPHPLQIARWMLRRTRTQTHWTFGPDHPSRASNVCLRPPVQLNANDAVEHDAPDFDGDEDGYDDQGLEMELAAADEVVFVDDEREGVKYTLENFELPITFLSPYPSRTGASNEQDQEYSSDVRSTDEPGASSAYNGTTPSPHTFLPHSSGPSSSSTQRPENISVSSEAAPDLEYVDAALRQQKAVRIETIHPGTSHPHGSSSSSSSREQKQKRSNGAAGSLASWLTGGWR